MTCRMCKERGKTWSGSDPTCSFPDGRFDSNGWNCATANAIRDIVYEGQDLPWWVNYQYCDDQKYGIINLDTLDAGFDGAFDDEYPLALWITWYKNRGSTDAMWLLFSDDAPRVPTVEECEWIIRAHGAKIRRQA